LIFDGYLSTHLFKPDLYGYTHRDDDDDGCSQLPRIDGEMRKIGSDLQNLASKIEFRHIFGHTKFITASDTLTRAGWCPHKRKDSDIFSAGKRVHISRFRQTWKKLWWDAVLASMWTPDWPPLAYVVGT